MVRTVLALLTLTLALPTLAADPATLPYDGSQACRLAFASGDALGCEVSHSGTVTVSDCTATSCLVTVSLTASADLPAGVQALESSVSSGARVPLCSATATTTEMGTTLGCAGEVSFTLPIPGECRLLAIETTASANRVLTGSVFTDVRVCKDGSVVRP